MEWGPRALGNRSILADPRKEDMKDKLNSQVKFRESFRPFAPSVLEDRVHEFFNCEGSFPFMNVVVDVLPEARGRIPAVTHVDGTARIQTVSRKTNPKYYDLIEEFDAITGVPVILNTSFNVKGEPIVLTPKEAIRCFYSTGMDYLVMDNYVIGKNEIL
jgi:carbamoyltransferase